MENHVFLAATLIVLAYFVSLRKSKLNHIPTLGYSNPLLSYITAYQFRTQSREMLEKGYKQFPGKIWKLATLDGWYIISNGPRWVEEMNKASGKELSAIISFESYLQLNHTLGGNVTTNPYHISVVRSPMTRNIGLQFDAMYEEAVRGIEEMMPPSSDEWSTVSILPAMATVVSRLNAMLAVGLPLCQNETFCQLLGSSSTVLLKGRQLRVFPELLRPIVAWALANPRADLSAMAKLLAPIVTQRLEMQHLNGDDWPEKPNDTLMWLMDAAQRSGEPVTPYGMATRLYLLTSATQETALILGCAVYEVTTRPEYIEPLRHEIEEVIARDGWTKVGISKLHKMDSFFKEILRCRDPNILHLGRRAVKDFVFPDGTLIPAGSDLFTNSYGMNFDEELNPSPHSFDGFRFVKEDSSKQAQMTKPGVDYVPFGYGKHACSGRFLAANQMKTMLAHMLVTYDLKTDKELHPVKGFVEKGSISNTEAKVYFKKRRSYQKGPFMVT